MYSGKIFFFTRNKDNFQKVSFHSDFTISFCIRLSSNLSISTMASTASSSSLLSINKYKNLDEMASRLHSKRNTKTKTKKNTKTKTKTQKQKQKHKNRNKNNNHQKKGKNKESFPLTRCWRHVLWADNVKLLLSAQGEIKSRASIIIYDGGEKKQWRRDHMVLRGTGGGGETVIANRVQRGGGYKTLTANEGIIKILQRFGGGAQG